MDQGVEIVHEQLRQLRWRVLSTEKLDALLARKTLIEGEHHASRT